MDATASSVRQLNDTKEDEINTILQLSGKQTNKFYCQIASTMFM